MGSNVQTVGSKGGMLLGRYGLFPAKQLGNTNTSVQKNLQTDGTILGNLTPANLSTAGTPGASVTNGNYVGQGITGAFDSGPLLFQVCSGWAKWGVMVRPDIPGNQNQIQGLSATIYGTNDLDTADGTLTTYNANGGVTSSANSIWFPIPTPSLQTGDGQTFSNPITAAGQAFWCNQHWAAIRINVSAITGGAVLFVIFAEP